MKKDPKTILIIDDDSVTIRILEKWLKVAGYKTISALSGESGFQRAKQESPDLIILDLMLPDINGVEVARRLNSSSDTKNIPIVVITVTMGVENDQGDEKIEIDDFSYHAFAKPLHSKRLLSTIRKLINASLYNKNQDS